MLPQIHPISYKSRRFYGLSRFTRREEEQVVCRSTRTIRSQGKSPRSCTPSNGCRITIELKGTLDQTAGIMKQSPAVEIGLVEGTQVYADV